MARLLPEDQKKKLAVSKSEAMGEALEKMEKNGRLSLLASSRFLGVSVLTIRDHVSKGRITTTQIGPREYIEAEDLWELKRLLDVYGSLAIGLKATEAERKHKQENLSPTYKPFDEEY